MHFHPGLFAQTARSYRQQHDADPAPRQIAVLRIDGNFASSYEDVMYHLFEVGVRACNPHVPHASLTPPPSIPWDCRLAPTIPPLPNCSPWP